MEGFKLDDNLVKLTWYTYVVEIIEHFSKFLKSCAVKNNDANNILISLKDFCFFIGIPSIVQTDNSTEYKNEIIRSFCVENKINHIFSSSRHPQSNGTVEIAHRETSRYIIIKILENDTAINLKDILLESNKIHNNNIHWITKYKPIDLINNTDSGIYDIVKDNIKTKYKNSIDSITNYKKDDHIKIKKGAYKIGNCIKIRKNKFKNLSFLQLFKMIIIVVYYM